MRRIVLKTLLVSTVIALTTRFAAAAEVHKDVSVAFWRDLPELNTVGTRVAVILRTHNIAFFFVNGCGTSVVVPADSVSKALPLLAEAIEDKKLPLTLTVFKEGRYVAVSPYSVLEPKTNK